jgi:hypothetical protein
MVGEDARRDATDDSNGWRGIFEHMMTLIEAYSTISRRDLLTLMTKMEEMSASMNDDWWPTREDDHQQQRRSTIEIDFVVGG